MATATTAKEVKTAETVEKPSAYPEKVTIRLPRALPGEEDTLFVGVNGKGYRIKKGVDVAVPRSVAEVLRHSEDAKDAALRYVESM